MSQFRFRYHRRQHQQNFIYSNVSVDLLPCLKNPTELPWLLDIKYGNIIVSSYKHVSVQFMIITIKMSQFRFTYHHTGTTRRLLVPALWRSRPPSRRLSSPGKVGSRMAMLCSASGPSSFSVTAA